MMPKPIHCAYSNQEIQDLIGEHGRFITEKTALEIAGGISARSLDRMVSAGQVTRYYPGGSRARRYKTAEVARLLRAEA